MSKSNTSISSPKSQKSSKTLTPLLELQTVKKDGQSLFGNLYPYLLQVNSQNGTYPVFVLQERDLKRLEAVLVDPSHLKTFSDLLYQFLSPLLDEDSQH